MGVGIESINFYVGRIYVSVRELFEKRELNLARFDNLMMNKKAVGLPWEDPVTCSVNAAKPILSILSSKERSNVELVITATESGVDFGKSLSTYAHSYLNLSKRCRLFEIKQACYAATAALQLAAGYVAANPFQDKKALILATDIARASAKGTYYEELPDLPVIAAGSLLEFALKDESFSMPVGRIVFQADSIPETSACL